MSNVFQYPFFENPFSKISIPLSDIAKMEKENEVKLISGMVFKTLEEAKGQNHIAAEVIKSEKIKKCLSVSV